MNLLSQNYLNEQMLKTHPHKVIGYITCTIRLDPGLVSSCLESPVNAVTLTLFLIRTLITNRLHKRQTPIVTALKFMIT